MYWFYITTDHVLVYNIFEYITYYFNLLVYIISYTDVCTLSHKLSITPNSSLDSVYNTIDDLKSCIWCYLLFYYFMYTMNIMYTIVVLSLNIIGIHYYFILFLYIIKFR